MPIDKIKSKQLLLIGLLGGLGGGINATLCFFNIPPEGEANRDFYWQVIPAGAIHGFLLSAMTIWFVCFLYDQRLFFRWIGMVLSAWIIGWISFMPIDLYMSFDTNHGWPSVYISDIYFLKENLFKNLLWPFYTNDHLAIGIISPFFYFGFVGLIYYLVLNICRQLNSKSLFLQLVWGCLSGVLGSFFWWMIWKSAFLCLIHGTIWGLLVGTGVYWAASKMPRGHQEFQKIAVIK